MKHPGISRMVQLAQTSLKMKVKKVSSKVTTSLFMSSSQILKSIQIEQMQGGGTCEHFMLVLPLEGGDGSFCHQMQFAPLLMMVIMELCWPFCCLWPSCPCLWGLLWRGLWLSACTLMSSMYNLIVTYVLINFPPSFYGSATTLKRGGTPVYCIVICLQEVGKPSKPNVYYDAGRLDSQHLPQVNLLIRL